MIWGRTKSRVTRAAKRSITKFRLPEPTHNSFFTESTTTETSTENEEAVFKKSHYLKNSLSFLEEENISSELLNSGLRTKTPVSSQGRQQRTWVTNHQKVIYWKSPIQSEMAQVPEARITPAITSNIVGIDLNEPFHWKVRLQKFDRTSKLRYGILYIDKHRIPQPRWANRKVGTVNGINFGANRILQETWFHIFKGKQIPTPGSLVDNEKHIKPSKPTRCSNVLI